MPLMTQHKCNLEHMEINSYIGLNNLNMSNLFYYIKTKIVTESPLGVINFLSLFVHKTQNSATCDLSSNDSDLQHMQWGLPEFWEARHIPFLADKYYIILS